MKQTKMTQTFPIKTIGPRRDHVVEYTEFVEMQAFNSPVEWEEGLKFFVRDSDQAKLNKISEKQFQVVQTGELIEID